MLKAISSHLKKNAPPCHRIQATPLHQHYGIHTLGVRLIEQLSKEKICPDSLIETMGPCLLMLVFAGKNNNMEPKYFEDASLFQLDKYFLFFSNSVFLHFGSSFPDNLTSSHHPAAMRPQASKKSPTSRGSN